MARRKTNSASRVVIEIREDDYLRYLNGLCEYHEANGNGANTYWHQVREMYLDGLKKSETAVSDKIPPTEDRDDAENLGENNGSFN